MRLKRLEMIGFKSFVDKTVLHFEPGLTAIVGPNGCGKSNVVDALRWVLGEQSAKNLRARAMGDVLFNGSGGRKPTGFAETTVVFENDGEELSGVAEIAITRRLFRSGDSEYLLNKRSCRLRDIKELFFDTGVGLDTYSVIEQGKIDAVLQASPSERRRLFEEAAGIRKALQKKQDSQSRLERIDENRARLADILREVEKQYEGVFGKARKAKKALVLGFRTEHLERGILHFQLDRIREDLEAFDREAVERSRQLRELDERLFRGKDELQRAQAEKRLAEKAKAAAQRDRAVRSEELESLERELVYLGRREEEVGRDLERRQQSSGKEAERQEALEAERERLRDELSRVSKEAESSDSECQEAKKCVQRAEGEIRERKRKAKELEAATLEVFRRAARVRNEVAAASARKKVLDARKSRLLMQMEKLATNQQAARLAVSDRDRLAEQAQEELGQIMIRLQELEGEAKETRDRREKAVERQHETELMEREAQSRLKVLEELEKKGEGLGKAGQALLESGRVMHLFGTRLRPVPEHVQAIAALLGERSAAVVAADLDDAEAALAWVDEQHLGPVRIAARKSPAAGIAQHATAPTGSGIVGSAVGLSQAKGPDAAILERLLGDALVVESKADALRLVREGVPGFRRFAALDGTVVSVDGLIERAGEVTGILSRTVEKAGLRERLDGLKQERTKLKEELAAVNREVEALQAEVERTRAELGRAKLAVVQTKAEMARAESELARIAEDLDSVEGEILDVGTELDEAGSLAEQRGAEADRLDAEGAQVKADVEALGQEISAAEMALSALQADEQRIAFLALERRKERDHLSQSLERTIADLNERIASAARLKERIEETERQLKEVRETLDARRHHRHSLDLKLGTLGAEEAVLGERVVEADRIRKEAEQLVEDLRQERESLQSLDAASKVMTREKEIRAASLQKQWEELGDSRDESALKGLECEDWEEDRKFLCRLANRDVDALGHCEMRLRTAKQLVARIGPTDPSTIDEARALEERLETLKRELEDLEHTVRDLTALISQIDNEARSRFEETVHKVRKSFKEIFRRLFGGGRAELVLEEGDLLEAGIEIFAKPPGKENRTLSLLSGGERVLTAMALLLALFETKPSPFCVLDEVDAALDEANVDRLVALLRHYIDRTQFLVVTHNKRTMSAADNLFGVTMEQSGISRPVAVRLEEVAPVGAA